VVFRKITNCNMCCMRLYSCIAFHSMILCHAVLRHPNSGRTIPTGTFSMRTSRVRTRRLFGRSSTEFYRQHAMTCVDRKRKQMLCSLGGSRRHATLKKNLKLISQRLVNAQDVNSGFHFVNMHVVKSLPVAFYFCSIPKWFTIIVFFSPNV